MQLEWEHYSNGMVPQGAVEGGTTPEGETYYIGHHSHNGNMLVGKIHTGKRMLYAPYNGQSVTKEDYGVLCTK